MRTISNQVDKLQKKTDQMMDGMDELKKALEAQRKARRMKEELLKERAAKKKGRLPYLEP
jgi:ABC-type siderophore export system fused ATPase/permease subunit